MKKANDYYSKRNGSKVDGNGSIKNYDNSPSQNTEKDEANVHQVNSNVNSGEDIVHSGEANFSADIAKNSDFFDSEAPSGTNEVDRSIRKPHIGMVIPLILAAVFSAVFIFLYFGNKSSLKIFENGTHVTANISEVIVGSKDNDEGEVIYYYYYLAYQYINDDGTVYKGTTSETTYRDKSEAEKHIGEEIQIIIGENGKSILANSDRPDPDSFIVPIIVVVFIALSLLALILVYCFYPRLAKIETLVAKEKKLEKKRRRKLEQSIVKNEQRRQSSILKVKTRNAKLRSRGKHACADEEIVYDKSTGNENILKIIGSIICALVFVGSVLLFAAGANNYSKASSYNKVEAKIIGQKEIIHSNGKGYAIVYEFFIDGVRYEFTDEVSGSNTSSVNGNESTSKPGVSEGKKVTIYVNPNNPKDVITKLEGNFFFIAGYIMFLFSFGFFAMAIIRPLLEKKLQNAAGLLGALLFILMGMLLFLAPGFMNYASTFLEFIQVNYIITIFGLLFAAFGVVAFIGQIIHEINMMDKK